MKRNIITCARKIPEGQITKNSRSYAGDGNADINAIIKDILD